MTMGADLIRILRGVATDLAQPEPIRRPRPRRSERSKTRFHMTKRHRMGLTRRAYLCAPGAWKRHCLHLYFT